MNSENGGMNPLIKYLLIPFVVVIFILQFVTPTLQQSALQYATENTASILAWLQNNGWTAWATGGLGVNEIPYADTPSSLSGDPQFTYDPTTHTLTIPHAKIDGSNFDLSSPTQGDIIYYNGTKWLPLAPGTSGQVLQTNGLLANPAWSSNIPTETIGQVISTNITGATEDYVGNQGDILWDYGGGTKLAKSSTANDATGKAGVYSIAGLNEFADFKVTTWSGTTIYANDFTTEALNAIPTGWAQWDNGGGISDWQVKTDVSHPKGRVVQQQTGGGFDTNCYYDTNLPSDGKYVITVDIKAHLPGLWNMGTTIFQSAPGTFYYLAYTFDNWLAFRYFGSPDLLARQTDVVAVADTWYSVKIIVDGQRMWGYIKTLSESSYHLWLTYNWGNKITIFEAPGALNRTSYGTIKQIWIARSDNQSETLNIYYDGSATPTISVPLADFFNGIASVSYATRFGGQSRLGYGFYRYIDIPYTAGIKIEIVNDVNTDTLIFWHIGYKAINPTNLGKYTRLYSANVTASVAPLAWQTFANLTGNGVIYSVYMHFENATEWGWAEGNVKILRDGSNIPILEASGTEDFNQSSFYWTGGAVNSDFVGTPYYTTPPGTPVLVSIYRLFIRDPIVFSNSLTMKWQNGQETEVVPAGNTILQTLVLYYKSS